MGISTILTLCRRKISKRYILQRINTRTFQDVEGLMENIHLVTGHISRKVAQTGGDVQRESMSLDSIRPRFVVS